MTLLLLLAGWLWPLGLHHHRLGPFAFSGPRVLDAPTNVASGDLEVELLTNEPGWVTSQERCEVAGLDALVQRSAAFAPVVGGSPWAPDVRDRSVTLWFPSLGSGLRLCWRSYGGWAHWLRDTRLARSSARLVRSLEIAQEPAESR